MKLRTSLHRLLKPFAAKPTPRRGWRAGIALEALEVRLNLSAVLVVETVDAYWLYDDADALLKGAADGQATACAPSIANSDFTPQEMKVIENIVAELIVSEGYNDNDILSISYYDNTTSDELIASGVFDDGFFQDDLTETAPNVADSPRPAAITVAPIDSSNKLSNLPGASRADAILPEEGEEVVEANARLRDRLTSPVVIAAQPAIETALDTSPVEPVAFAIRPAESRSELNDRSLEMQNREEVAEPQQVSPPSPRTKAEAVAITAVTQLANASAFMLPFAKFPTADLARVGIVSGLNYANSFWSPESDSHHDASPNPETEELFHWSYSQIAAAFGASGLAVAHWLNSHRTFEGASSSRPTRRRLRGWRQTSL
jgi:hypothetical protein